MDDLLALPIEMLRQYEDDVARGGPSVATITRLQTAIDLFEDLYPAPQVAADADAKLRALASAMMPVPAKWIKAEYNIAADAREGAILRNKIMRFVNEE
jgi:hypothetical protein